MTPKLEKTTPAFVNKPSSENTELLQEVQGILWLQEGLVFPQNSPQNTKCHKLACSIRMFTSSSKPTLSMVYAWHGSASPATAQTAALQQVQLTLHSAHVGQDTIGFTWPLSMLFCNPHIFKEKCSSHLRACKSPSIEFGEGAHQGGH